MFNQHEYVGPRSSPQELAVSPPEQSPLLTIYLRGSPRTEGLNALIVLPSKWSNEELEDAFAEGKKAIGLRGTP